MRVCGREPHLLTQRRRVGRRYGRKKKKSFDEYCAMREYQNIMTKMLALDKLPYGDYGELTSKHVQSAKQRLLQFAFVGEALPRRQGDAPFRRSVRHAHSLMVAPAPAFVPSSSKA